MSQNPNKNRASSKFSNIENSGKGFARILEEHGWSLKSIKGSHRIFTKRGNPARSSVPIHGNKPLKVELWKHPMKIAAIDENEC